MTKNNQAGLAPIIIILVIGAVGAGIYLFTTQKFNQGIPQEQTNIKEQESISDAEVVIKENPEDKSKSDIYLKDTNGQETFFITLDDVYTHHIHNSEYHNGNLYIIRRTGGEEGYQDIPDWTDELWKYDSNKKSTKLYGIRGLDFRVSNDDKLIGIVGAESDEEDIVAIIDTNGNPLAEFGGDDLGVSLMEPLVWGKNSFWLVDLALPYPKAFIRIDIDPYEASIFDVEDVGIGMEHKVNPDTQKLVYSDYPPLFDEDSAKEFAQSDEKVILTVYDLESKEKQEIDTSIAKKFNPKWVNDNTIEYDNPKGEGRLTKNI